MLKNKLSFVSSKISKSVSARLFLCAFLCVPLISCGDKNSEDDVPLVAVTQIIEHRALDQEREGFIKSLESAGLRDQDDFRIIVDMAQGNVATSTQIAQKFVSLHPKVIVAFSTPSAQTAVSVSKRAGVPVVFSAVTDAKSSKIVSSYDAPRPENVTGVVDYIPPHAYISFIQKVFPHARRIGVIFNAGEANSIAIIHDLRTAFDSAGLTYVPATVSKASEVTQAAQSLVGKVDMLFIPNDNTAVSAISSIVRVGEKNKIPIIAADFGSFAEGVMGVMGYDRDALGQAVGRIVVDILQHNKKASDIPVVTDHEILMYVNRDAAVRMGYTLPNNLDDVQVVGDTEINL